jgi:hypothetical protein
VNELLARAGSLFFAPAQAPVARPREDAPPPDLVGVLAAASDLPWVAGAVAADLRRRHRSRAALVLLTGGAPLRGPATRAARAVAARLADRGLDATAAGGVCRVGLPAAGEEAVRDAWRAITASAGHPVVVALRGRGEEADALLAEADLLVLAPPRSAQPEVAELALASLAALTPPAVLLRPPAGALARRFTRLSLAALPTTVPVP